MWGVSACCWKPGNLISQWSGGRIRTPHWLHLTYCLHAVSLLRCYQRVSTKNTAAEQSRRSLTWLWFSQWPLLVYIPFGVMNIIWYNHVRVYLHSPSLCVLIPLSSLIQADRHSSEVGQGWTRTAGKVCVLLQEAEAPWLCLRDLFQDGRPAGSSAAACGNAALGRGLTHLRTREAHLLCSSWLIYRVSWDNHINIMWTT